jgi:predicted nucleotidyltransferase
MDEKINKIVDKVKNINGVIAIVVGGSHATGIQRPDSDIDLGIYYSKKNPLNISQIKSLAHELNDRPDVVVAEIGEWGPWVNGGAWLTIEGQRVDFLYRDLDFVNNIIDDCIAGKIEKDYYQQPPYGFYSYIYLAETYHCKVLFDPNESIAALKRKIEIYPAKLKQTIINDFLWNAEFSFAHAHKAAQRGEIYFVAGCLTRITNCLVQTVYALNETYFIGEKKFAKDEPDFKIKPTNFIERINEILGNVGDSPENMNLSLSKTYDLLKEIISLSADLYQSKYNI